MTILMKRSIFTPATRTLLLLLLSMFSMLNASAQEAYAVYTSNNTTLTFYYDGNRSTHTLSTETVYDLNDGSNAPAWYTDKKCYSITTVVFDASFANARPTNTNDWFVVMMNLTDIQGLEYLNTSEVTNMSGMFSLCQKLPALDVSHFNTAKVTSMNSMFNECNALQTLDLSSFETQNVTDMQNMFSNCRSLTTLDLTSFDTQKVNNMGFMFKGCSGITTLNLSSFDTQKVVSMIQMFNGCSSLKTIFVGENWSVAGVTNSTDMFKDCTKLVGGAGTACDGTNNIDKEYARVDVPDNGNAGYLSVVPKPYVVYASGTLTFYYNGGWYSSTGTVYDLNEGSTQPAWKSLGSSVKTVAFDASFADARPTTTYGWFMSLYALSKINNIEYLNTSAVTDMRYMFQNCFALTTLDLSSWNTASVTNMQGMFQSCRKLTCLDLSGWNIANVNSMSVMFNDCPLLTTIYVDENWNVSNVINSVSMFSGCPKIVGGAGTPYNDSYLDKTYARIDQGPTSAAPGYLTSMAQLRYTLHSSSGVNVALTYDPEEKVFKSDIDMTKGDDFFFEDINGNYYVSKEQNVYVDADHCVDLPVEEINMGTRNFKMEYAGIFTFKLKVRASGKTLTVIPTSGVWPPLTPIYRLCHDYNGETVYIPFTETEPGEYELNYTFPDFNLGFWFNRVLEEEILSYANPSNNGGNLKLTRYNSKDLTLTSTNRADFVFWGKGPATFHITDKNDGHAPKLTITDWPQSMIDLAYDDSQVGQLTYDEATDTYSIEYTVEKNKDIWFIDVTYGRPLMVNSDEDLTLNRKTSSNIVLSAYPTCSSGGRFLQMKQGGTFTFKVKLTDEGALVDVVWPDPIFRPNIPNAPDFVKQPDGSYTTEVTLNFEQVGNDGCQFDIIDASMAELDYYGIPNVMLTRKNSQNLELGQGDDFYNIHLYKVGTYTLTISPDFKLSIGWPEADYYLYVRDNNYKTTFVPFNYDAETETYFIKNYPLEEGFGVWICDDATGQGYGIPGDDNYPPLTREFAANGFVLYPSGWIPIIQATGNFTFAMKEQENGNGLDVTMTGWPMPYYIYDIYKEENVGTFVENGDGTCSCTLEVTDDMIDTNYFRFAIADDDEKYYYSGDASNIIVSGNNQTFQLMAIVPGVSVYPIHIKPGQYILTFNPATLTLTVKNSIHGDVNGDGNVTFADVTALVNIILDKPSRLSDNSVNYQVTKNPSYINYESHSFNLGGKALKAIEFALGLSPTELAEKMVQNNTNPLANGEARFMPVDANGNLVCTSSTANNYGYWFNDDGEVDSWGPTAKVGVEMSIPDGNITLVTFQYPDHNQSGDKISIPMALVYKNNEGKQGMVWFTFDFVFKNANAVTLKSVSIPVLDSADINSDTNVTIADVTKLVNILWGKE